MNQPAPGISVWTLPEQDVFARLEKRLQGATLDVSLNEARMALAVIADDVRDVRTLLGQDPTLLHAPVFAEQVPVSPGAGPVWDAHVRAVLGGSLPNPPKVSIPLVPLQLACQKGSWRVAEFLLDVPGIDPDRVGAPGVLPPLLDLVQDRATVAMISNAANPLIEKLLGAGANPLLVTDPLIPGVETHAFASALRWLDLAFVLARPGDGKIREALDGLAAMVRAIERLPEEKKVETSQTTLILDNTFNQIFGFGPARKGLRKTAPELRQVLEKTGLPCETPEDFVYAFFVTEGLTLSSAMARINDSIPARAMLEARLLSRICPGNGPLPVARPVLRL